MSSSLAPTLIPNPVALWHGAIENLSPHASPCRYLAPAKWAGMRADALTFLDHYGAEAHRLGWTAPQLFGVHPEHGTLRVEYTGVLMVNDRLVVSVQADRIVFDRCSGYRTKPGQMWGPPVWGFARKAT